MSGCLVRLVICRRIASGDRVVVGIEGTDGDRRLPGARAPRAELLAHDADERAWQLGNVPPAVDAAVAVPIRSDQRPQVATGVERSTQLPPVAIFVRSRAKGLGC